MTSLCQTSSNRPILGKSICLLGTELIFCFLFLGKLMAQQEIKPCQNQPAFIKTLGLDPVWTGLSTSEKNKVGLVLVEFEKKAGQSAPTAANNKRIVFQHESWKTKGYLSTICLDNHGNVYTIPAPLISMLYNKVDKLNTIYQINSYTGVMNEWFNLPFTANHSVNNPYGLLGITYDCSSDILIAATVAGSDRYHERGVVYLIHAATKKIVDIIQYIDVIGLAVGLDEQNRKRLYFAKTRNGWIYSMLMSNNGKLLKSSIRKELSLDGYGPRGDDKARKIKFINHQLQISGTAFHYNLQAQSEKPETVYTFNWDARAKKWELIHYQ